MDIGTIARKFPQETEKGLRVARDKLLKAIEEIQILKYTTSSNPAALRYRRTFTLRRSSKTKAQGNKLPDVGGVWWADESIAPYAEEVIGPSGSQAGIHRGRWLSLEQISAEAEQLAPDIYEEALKNEVDF